MSAILNNSVSMRPPVVGKDLIVLASTTTHDAVEIPSDWLQSWLTVHADGADVYLAFSTSASAEVAPTGTTTLDGAAVSAIGATNGWKIPEGQTEHFNLAELPKLPGAQKWHLVHEESAASAYVRCWRSSGPATRD